jgi:serine/threonine protein kinase
VKLELDPTKKINTQSAKADSIAPDIQIPGYKIQRELGQGGMAHVYLAIQESFGREVALKVLSPHLADDEEFSKRFLREARIVSQLNHPNIVTVFDAGKHGKHHYMSMEYIPGKDLKHLKDSISRKDAIRIVKDVARALDFAGTKGIVHRDVKPENIMIHQNDNRVILMDFGIAHGDDVTHGMTQTGKAIGTPHFMSPEQTKGLKVDHRSDIYSLGIVLFQLLAGHLPFDADSAVAVGIKHLTAPIPLLPGGLEIFQPIINHCLSKQPQHRYQKAAEVIAALDKINDEQLEDIKTKASDFKKAGANHNAETQVSDVVISKRRKVPDIVFPSSNKTTINESVENKNTNSTRRRNLLFLLLISTMIWAGNEKQKELTHFWGYKALPKIAKQFPDLFPKSYLQYWVDKSKSEKTPTVVTSTTVTPAPSPDEVKNTQLQSGQTEIINATPASTSVATAPQAIPQVTPEEAKKDELTLLKEGLEKNPENAIKIVAIYKEMLLQSKQDPIARKGLKDLREWYIKQISLAFATEDAALARQHINLMKQNFPLIINNKRFIRLEKKVAFLERIDTHFVQAEKYFKAGALSKPINKNAQNEIQKVLTLSPNNEDAKTFMDKIINAYLEKTTQLQEQGNMHNALLMVEEGIAALNNNPTLVKKREDIKERIKRNKNIASLFKQANKYQTAGQFIKPQAYNAYDIYQRILRQDEGNLQAKAGLKSIHQRVAKDITSLIQKGRLEDSSNYLELAIQRYGKSSLLASVQLKLNDALNAQVPKIETVNFSRTPLTILETSISSSDNIETLQLNKTVYVGFNYINFSPAATWLDVILFDTNKRITIAQKPIVISNQFGEYFFEINLPIKGFTNSKYKIELKLKDKTLKSKSFLVRN